MAREVIQDYKLVNESKKNARGLLDARLKKDGKWYGAEFKEDFLAQKTGNIAVEFSCRDKPSGISKTQADIWCVTIHENFKSRLVLTTVDDLKNLLDKKLYLVVNMGDKKIAQGYLVPLKDYLEIARGIYAIKTA